MEYIGNIKKQGSIVEILKEEILSGRIPGGTELTQNELAVELGVSRMPVREALIILEYQGLMERLPNNHVRVAEFSEAYFKELFHVCAELEKAELESADMEVFDEMSFHRHIYRGMQHSFLKKSMETMVEIYVAFAVDQDQFGACERLGLLKDGMIDDYFEKLAVIVQRARK